MDGGVHLVVSSMLDSILVLAGHGDSITGNQVPTRPSGSEDEGGIGMVPIVGVLVIALVTVGVLVWLNRQDRQTGDAAGGRSLNLKAMAPAGLIAAVIATPLIVWTASSGGDEKNLKVERWTSTDGKPELLVSLTETELNTLATTKGRRTVSLECRGRDGQRVLTAEQKWPLLKESGYEFPHAHQAA